MMNAAINASVLAHLPPRPFACGPAFDRLRRMFAPAPQCSMLRLLSALFAALLLSGCMGALDTPIDLDSESVERKLLAQSSDGDLLDRGVELYAKGNYTAAARRLQILVDRSPHDFDAAAYLGLSLWFTGRSEQAASLWEQYENPKAPEEEDFLRAHASGLRLLANRLRARSFLDEFRRGKLPPMVPGTVALLPSKTSDPKSPDAPKLIRGLHHDLHEALGAQGPLRPAPEGLSLALLAESPSAPGRVQGTDALRIARILGAEYAVTVEAWTPMGAPEILRTRLSAQATEPLPLRARRLARDRDEASAALKAALADEKTLDDRRGRCAGVIRYFDKKSLVDALLEERDHKAEETSRLNREGLHADALEAIRRYQELEREISSLQAELREFERSANPALDGAGRFTPEAYHALADRLARQHATAAARAKEAAGRERAARARASRDWRAARAAVFDVPLAYVSRWRSLALDELARLTGEPAPGQSPAGPGLNALVFLHKGLEAWEDGEYDAADILFGHPLLDGLADLPTRPAPGFDLLQLLDLPPAELAARLEEDVLRGPAPAWMPR